MKLYRKVCWFILFFSALAASLPACAQNDSAGASAAFFRRPLELTDELQTQPTCMDTLAWFMQAILEQLDRMDVLVAIAVDQDSASLHRWHNLLPTRAELGSYSEVLILTDVLWNRETVEKNRSEHYFDSGPERRVRQPGESAKNIRTEVSVRIEYRDTTGSVLLGSSVIRGVSENGSWINSRDQAETVLNNQLVLELYRIYGISVDVAFDKAETKVSLGKKNGVFRNMNFQFITPELAGDRLAGCRWQPAAPGGCGRITAVGDSTSLLKVYRQWHELPAGSFAIPCRQPVLSFSVHVQPPLFNSYSQYGFYVQGNPMAAWDWGLGASILRLQDSQDDQVYGCGFGLFTRRRLWCSRSLDAGIKIGGDLDIPMRKDAYGSSVSMLLWSMQLALTGEMVLSYRVNLAAGAGYRFSKKTDSWLYANDHLNSSGGWDREAPAVSNRGFLISVGCRYCLF